MSGDTINMAVQSYYNSNSVNTNNSSFTDVLNSLANALFTTTGGSHGNVSNFTSSGSTVYTGLNSFLGSNDPVKTGYPKAYLNWIFLDDQFNYVSSLSGAIAVASSTYAAGTLNTVAPGSALTLNRSGYLYIWVSNETQNWDVFFDNLSVQHKQGPMLEENHYYPFGLAMAGISDKALKPNYTENKYRYNGGTELQNKEFSDGSGLELYDANARMYDPQIGRFGGIDALSSTTMSISSYSFGFDDPVMFNDPTGMKVAPKNMTSQQMADWVSSIKKNFNYNDVGEDGGGGGFDDGSSGGSGGEDYSGISDAYAVGSDGYTFLGEAAQQLIRGLQNAMNNADANGNWAFDIGRNKNGAIGYWESYGFTSSDPSVINGMEQLAGAGVGQRFVNLDNGPGNAEKANKLADQYDRNENRAMAYSFTMEALFETTETGQLLTKVRESMVQTYGDRSSKEASEVYSNVIEIIRGIKEEVPGGKMSDLFIDAAAFKFGIAASSLQAEDEIIGLRIEMLDANVYDNRILKIQNYQGGGGGASSIW